MLSNYLTIIFRKLRKERLYSIINLLGLTIGLTAFLLITLYVRDELSYDKFHTNHEQLYRVYATDTTREVKLGGIAPDLARIILSDIPAVESAVRMISGGKKSLLTVGDERIYSDKVIFSDANFFEMLDFRLMEGVAQSVLSQPYQAVITTALAEKLFGEENPIGKAITLNKERELVVTGISETPPNNSSLRFDMVIRSGVAEMDTQQPGSMMPALTYLKIPEDNDKAQVVKMINELKAKSGYGIFVEDDVFGLLPITDQRLHAGFTYAILTDQSDIRFVYLFSGIGLVILLLAVINYVNMVTASSLKRAKEIGLRKVIGAQKSQLVWYQLVESVVVTTIALVIAFALTERLLPIMNGLLGKTMELKYFSLEFLLFVPLMGLIIGVLTGLYPSFYISRYKPLVLLKNNMSGTAGKGGLRRVLVGFQFLVAGIMILVTLIMHSQMKFLKEQKMGFDEELLVYVPLFEDLKGKSQVFKNEVLGMSGVSEATVTNWMFGNHTWSGVFGGYYDSDTEERPPYVEVSFVLGDEDVINTLGLKVLESEEGFKIEQLDSTKIVISKLVADGLGWKDESVIGKYVYQYAGYKMRVVAVIEDFHSSSLKDEILPSVILNRESWSEEKLLIRFESEGHQATLKEIKSKYESLLNRPFEFSYVDDEIEKYYKEEADQVALFNAFSGLAIFISLLGLIAMATYSAEQRKKEVSIRKVLGASLKQLILLLNKENGVLVIIAFLVATPITIYAMQDWLAEFKYRISIQPMLFVLVLAGFFILNVLVTLYFSLKVSRTNPADTLREE